MTERKYRGVGSVDDIEAGFAQQKYKQGCIVVDRHCLPACGDLRGPSPCPSLKQSLSNRAANRGMHNYIHGRLLQTVLRSFN